MEDARVLLGSALVELELPKHEHFTHRQGESASRLDRFYLSSSLSAWMQWLEVTPSPMISDHAEIMLHLRDPARRRPTQRRSSRPPYPFRGSHTERIIQELLEELLGSAPQRDQLRWDCWIKASRKAVKNVAQRDKKRRKQVAVKLKRQIQENSKTGVQLVTALVDDLRQRKPKRAGDRLHRTREQVRWLFKETAVWERDQTVSQILPPPNLKFDPDMPIQERFSKVWKQITGKRHSQCDEASSGELCHYSVGEESERGGKHSAKGVLAV
ncbi:hypothetical protein PPTG_07856 [Phytophthora nicotianae INRA-310]|uniref:Endonuclease/exonuclease/phosphatase domain-containing protein n=3 Tax=Phytophthora nicotianae TaxID=4792 RepID=W2QM07_PHYN3|nr:hypothetical protein PPTG_07856 [Phytophthora nicotianae INRA-310]ETN14222.1 hypothetical protein PPTG_07856 [Phytophthora nicotianae INRA-310]